MIPSVKVLLFLAISVVVISLRQTESAPQTNYEQFALSNSGKKEPVSNGKELQQKPTSGNRTNSKDEIFGFPAEQSEIESKQNAHNRQPVYVPSKVCQENEILYPGDQESDWVCDCKPTFVYHPASHKCYEMYTQGFCGSGEMIYLKPGDKHPKCIPNRCYQKGSNRVPLNKDVCVTLNEYSEHCDKVGDIKFAVGIDEATHEVICMNISDVKLNSTTTIRPPLHAQETSVDRQG